MVSTEPNSNQITAKFRQEPGNLLGSILKDGQSQHVNQTPEARNKIVFISQSWFIANRHETVLPQHGQIWLCEVCNEINKENPFKGCLLVKPLKDITNEEIETSLITMS